ncbi:MAG: LEPR-XLL domain-containing protein [Candidatus Dormibacteria bacterium]
MGVLSPILIPRVLLSGEPLLIAEIRICLLVYLPTLISQALVRALDLLLPYPEAKSA